MFIIATVCTALIGLGFLFSPSGGELWKVIGNRLLSAFVIWSAGLVSYQWKLTDQKTNDSLLDQTVRRKRAEEASWASQAQFQGILDSASDAIISVDEDQRIILFNQEAEHIFGYEAKEVMGEPLELLLPARFRGGHKDHVSQFAAGSVSRRPMGGRAAELFGLRKSGEEFHVEISISQLDTRSGIILTAVVKDVTEGKRAEQALEMTQFAVDHADIGISWTRADGHFAYVNNNTCRYLGYSRDELLSMRVPDINPDQTRRDWASRWKEIKEAGSLIIEARHKAKDGSLVPVEIMANHGIFGGDEYLFSFVRNVTERKQTEEKLAQYVTELERSNTELDDFAYIASHDLKEPLRGIHNYSQFLLEDYTEKLDEDGRAKLETLLRLTQRLEGLIDSLLYFSRLGRDDLSSGETDLNEVLHEVIDSLDISLQERGIEVRIPQPLLSMTCDRVRVAEIFRNLITNAMKYNDKPEKWIEIGLRENGQSAENNGRSPSTFYVRDNGIGIREKHLDSVFRIFKRLNGREAYGGGTGAGLTITKKIVERHGGKIWTESTYGEGTTFFFTLRRGV